MTNSRRKLLLGIFVLLVGGVVIGWLYGRPVGGLLVAALLGLAWQTRQLLRFDAALDSSRFGSLKYGDSIWSTMYSRYNYQRQQAKDCRKDNRRLFKEFRKSTNAMPDGAVILNQEGEIVLCNKAAGRLAGFRRKADRGQRVDNILRDPSFGKYLRSGGGGTGVEISSPVAEDSWLLCRVVPYGLDQELLLIQDITERRRLSTVRREFVANASHELRSPLTVIRGYLDAIADDGDLSEGWRAPVQEMQEQANRMTRIVTELMQLSRLESGGSATLDDTVDVCALLTSARKSVASQKNVANVSVDCESNAMLLGNVADIESIIDNLLSNALQHTEPEGKVVLRWRDEDDKAVLSVTDSGIGIEAEHFPRLTERFFRIDQGRSRDTGGVGLGLAIVKHALEKHDARLEIDSTVGAGSTFACHFPAKRVVRESSGLS